jgi:hypothetical protein
MGSALDMPRQDMAHRTARLQRRVKRIDCSPRNPEGAIDALLLQNQNRRIDCAHFRHDYSSIV